MVDFDPFNDSHDHPKPLSVIEERKSEYAPSSSASVDNRSSLRAQDLDSWNGYQAVMQRSRPS